MSGVQIRLDGRLRLRIMRHTTAMTHDGDGMFIEVSRWGLGSPGWGRVKNRYNYNDDKYKQCLDIN